MHRPQTEAELAEIVAGSDVPLRICGGGTRGIDGPGEVVSAAGLSGVTLYEPGALTLVVQAGTPVAEIEALLAGEGQRLAFEPLDHRGLLGSSGEPTIGGVIAGNVSGPRRVQAGAARDHALGLRFVDGRGDVVSNGGRVMKNVTGYDLVKLMAGSFGTLGVLTEVSLKVLPATETEASLQIAVTDAGAAVAVMSAALGSPFEVSGAGHDAATGLVSLRIEGFGDQVSYRCGALSERLVAQGDVAVLEQEASRALWLSYRDVAPFHGVSGDVWRVSCAPSAAPGLIARAEAEGAMLDWGGGLIWLRLPEGSDLRARLGSYDGHATLVRGRGHARFEPKPGPLAALEAGLRRQFDPKGIFNPGLMAEAEEA